MKKIINSFKIAFMMYSKIPMPKTEWSGENMRYAMCFFPLVGTVIGIIQFALFEMAIYLNFSEVHEIILLAAILVVLPISVTGGIHLDGLLDTADAINSHRDFDKRLEILKDPRAGAFAVITCTVYILIYFATYYFLSVTCLENTALANQMTILLCLNFTLARAFSGLSVVTFKMAKNTGLAHTFSDNAQRKITKNVLVLYAIGIFTVMLVVNIIFAVAMILSLLIAFFYYKRMSLKQFGGITGDLCGYFLQIAEIAMPLSLVIVYIIMK